jgi:hypothetical protein
LTCQRSRVAGMSDRGILLGTGRSLDHARQCAVRVPGRL